MPATMAKAIKLSSQLKSPPRLSRSTLHPYRLKVKELRDVLQLSDRTADKDFLKELGEVKDAIGEWHDWEELTSIAGQSARPRPFMQTYEAVAEDQRFRIQACSVPGKPSENHLSTAAKAEAGRSHEYIEPSLCPFSRQRRRLPEIDAGGL